MWLPLKAIILNKPRKDGNSLIYFQYCVSVSKRVLLSTEIAVPAQYWNKKRQIITNSLPEFLGAAENLNAELKRMRKVIEELIDHGLRNDIDDICLFLKQNFNPEFRRNGTGPIIVPIKKKETDIFEQLDLYIKAKEKRVVSTAIIKALKARLLQFQSFTKRPVTFASLDYNFYIEFLDFLTYDYVLRRKKTVQYGLKVSTIGSTIKHLRVFINDRKRRKIITNVDVSDFKIPTEESDAIYLSYEEIGMIYRLDMSTHPHLADDRDLFVLGCLTGLRFSDYSTLRFSDLRNGMLYKKTEKQDSWAVIPMRKEAQEIFIRQFKGREPKISNPVFNKSIKEIATLAGITESVTFSYKKGNKDIVTTKPKALWVTSHTCRRSFATNEYLAGTDVNLIMKITGHKTYKDFFKYIRIGQEEAALKIQEVWQTRNNMQVFTASKTA